MHNVEVVTMLLEAQKPPTEDNIGKALDCALHLHDYHEDKKKLEMVTAFLLSKKSKDVVLEFLKNDSILAAEVLVFLADQKQEIILSTLLQDGVNQNVATFHHRITALWQACIRGDVGVVEMLLNAKLGPSKENAQDAFCHMASDGKMEMLNVFLQHGMDEDAIDAALVAAASSSEQRLDAVELLLQRKPCPKAVSEAFANVVQRRHLEVLERFLRPEVLRNINCIDAQLGIVVGQGDVELTRRLLLAGANPNAVFGKEADRYTPHTYDWKYDENIAHMLKVSALFHQAINEVLKSLKKSPFPSLSSFSLFKKPEQTIYELLTNARECDEAFYTELSHKFVEGRFEVCDANQPDLAIQCRNKIANIAQQVENSSAVARMFPASSTADDVQPPT
jgi:hypothetical protein